MKKKILYGVSILLILVLVTSVIIVKSIFPGMTFVGTAAISTVTSSTDKFKYQPDRIIKGSVYHYAKSNLDGTKPGRVSIYVADNDKLEVYKIYPGSNATFFVTTTIDWTTFSSKELTGYEMYNDGSKKTVARGVWSKASDSFTYESGKKYSVPIGHYPWHNINFDFISFNYTFRHLANPECEFDIGVHYPAFDLMSMIRFVYPGKAHIKYVTDDKYNGADCRKYEMTFDWSKDKTGYIWVSKQHGCFENVELPISDNPGWSSFKFTLKGTETMTRQEWEQYMADQNREYFKDR